VVLGILWRTKSNFVLWGCRAEVRGDLPIGAKRDDLLKCCLAIVEGRESRAAEKRAREQLVIVLSDVDLEIKTI